MLPPMPPPDPRDQEGPPPGQPPGAASGASAGSVDGSQPEAKAAPDALPFFYYKDDEDDPDTAQSLGSSSSFAHPFQPSIGMLLVTAGAAPRQSTTMPAVPSAPRPPSSARSLFSSIRAAWALGLIVLMLVLGGVLVLAHGAPPAAPRPPLAPIPTVPAASKASSAKGGNPGLARLTPTPTPQAPGAGAGNGGVLFTPSSPQTLTQLGWTQAGLVQGDEVEAYRVAVTFTDREMSEDFRTIGTLAHHGGTLTAATFLLTPGARRRFVTNDLRMMNNVLYQKVLTQQLIQQVLPSQPELLAFRELLTQQGLRPIATISVPFELWQSRLDPATGQRTAGIERDGTTQQPIVHHMTVLLLRVPPVDQGPNAPMGGAGWLVNNYALDSTAQLEAATSPAL